MTIVVKEDGSTIVAAADTENFIEPDAAIVTESPSGTARLDLSQYALLSGRTDGQTLVGATAAGSNQTLRLFASDSGVLGLEVGEPIGILIGDNLTDVKGLVLLLGCAPVSGVDIDASANSVFVVGYALTSSFGSPWVVVDDTNQIGAGLLIVSLSIKGNDKSVRDRFTLCDQSSSFIGDTGTLSMAVVTAITNKPTFQGVNDGVAEGVQVIGFDNSVTCGEGGRILDHIGFLFNIAGDQRTPVALLCTSYLDETPGDGFSLLSLEPRLRAIQLGRAALGANAVLAVTLADDLEPDDTEIVLTDSSQLPSSGVLYTRAGDRFIRFTANNTMTNTLTLDAPFVSYFGSIASSTVCLFLAVPTAQLDLCPSDSPALNVLDAWRNVVASVRQNGTVAPTHLADTSAENDSIYYSTDASKLVYKDSGGTVHPLY